MESNNNTWTADTAVGTMAEDAETLISLDDVLSLVDGDADAPFGSNHVTDDFQVGASDCPVSSEQPAKKTLLMPTTACSIIPGINMATDITATFGLSVDDGGCIPDDIDALLFCDESHQSLNELTKPHDSGLSADHNSPITKVAAHRTTIDPPKENGKSNVTDTKQKKPARPRKRQKDELDYLRIKVKEMEQELENLRQAELTTRLGATDLAVSSNLWWASTNIFAGDDATQPNSTSVVTQMWKQIATHQKEESTRALMENQKLRSLLEAQLQVAKNLETAFAKRQKLLSDSSVPNLSDTPINFSDTVIFSTLGHDLDTQQKQIDAVLEACGLTNIDFHPSVEAHPQNDENGMYFEHFDSRILPFPRPAAMRAMWHVMTSTKKGVGDSVFEVHEIYGDKVYAKATDVMCVRKSVLNLQVHIVMQRYSFKNRDVIVWETFVQTEGSCSLRLREKGWQLLVPLVTSSPNMSGLPATVLKRYVRTAPDLSVFETTMNVEVGAMTNMVINSCRRNMVMLCDMVENLLQNEAN